MNAPILFQSLDRIDGKEGRSKLLHNESELYKILHRIKAEIQKQYSVGSDRMDLHIEITKKRDDAELRSKAESLHEQIVDLKARKNWDFMDKAFVLRMPEVKGYGKTHATVAWFGDFPKPSFDALYSIIEKVLKESAV